ncbi:uncharacterized protein NECHADRAFT_86865 [Fusarium vanettenii 77-13-4]|uniref:NACHT domain-containing protein n=1 Tax=Fusarium vanettenii (strain ATCC MYA-4622 / CBS 123669 / FGSC 9596 / NRRL 45880 / 77-13-4) TaxID=660122 RepID=C7ZK14_FUSV7|nr:uncharacterized protein NECHADRAFT_86865 [Fusarium vanettenii 77-13-4]EEU35598.1 hypothetical protein NECHADRAFT_86865 [Fusarium vanettenii 77-13-4]
MAEVAGLALGAVGVAGLIGAFKDTIDLFGLLADSRGLGRDYEILQIKFDIQKALLLQWTDRVGLLHECDYDPCLDQAHIQEAIGQILSCIRLLLTDASALKSKYGLSQMDDEAPVSEITSIPSISAWRMRVFNSQYEEFKRRIAQRNDKPFRTRARWAVRDKQKFEGFVRDLADFISSLDKLTPVTRGQPSLQNMADDDVKTIRGLPGLKMLLEASQNSHKLISESTQRKISRTCEEMILSRLWFRKIHDRREDVADAHLDTLQWALYPPKGEARWDDLSQWLRQDSEHGIYWISGKAGSGKSTLMKYLHSQERTRRLLREWSGASSYTLVDFFFFNLGTQEQKSFEGLSRALLYQILKPNPSLIHQALPDMVKELKETENSPSLPSLSEIRYAFRVLTRESAMGKSFIFIDGLDEFEGNIRESISLIQELGRSRHIKVLVSSRPIPACVAAYENLPKLHLQDLTRKDIRAYVEDVIGSHQYIKRLLKRSPDGVKGMMEDLVNKSSGVFLWVVLACRSLLSGFEDCDRLLELRRRVDELPPELEDLFDLMLAKINQRYKHQGAYLLRLCYESQRASRNPDCPALSDMSTLALALIDDSEISTSNIWDLSTQEKIDLCAILEGRLRSRCGGLLEKQSNPNHADADNPGASSEDDLLVGGNVVFMHRTVFEYLSDESVWERDCLKANSHGRTVAKDLSTRDFYLMILYVDELKWEDGIIAEIIEDKLAEALRSGLFWVQMGDTGSQMSFFGQLPHLLSELNACRHKLKDGDLSFLTQSCPPVPDTTMKNYLHSTLLLAADVGAREYMVRNPEFSTLNGSRMPACGCPPLLSLEFKPLFRLATRNRPSPKGVSLLLRSGANPGLGDRVFTPWLLWLQDPSGLTRELWTDDELVRVMDVAETMTRYDAGGIRELRRWLNECNHQDWPVRVRQRGDELLQFLEEHEKSGSYLTKDHILYSGR